MSQDVANSISDRLHNVIAVTKGMALGVIQKKETSCDQVIALLTRSFTILSISRRHTVPSKNLQFSTYGTLQGEDEIILFGIPPMDPAKFSELLRKA